MPNSKGFIRQLPQDIGEAVIKPAADELGKAIEIGAQTVFSGPPQPKLTPRQSFLKQQQEQKGLAEVRRKIAWWKNLDEAQRKVREKQQSLDIARDKQEQEKKQVKQLEVQKKKQPLPEEVRARTLAERKMGRGVGG